MAIARRAPGFRVEDGVLDRSSFVPLYYQLQEVLKERIESGRWRPGGALPSEPALARQFGVSRIVVRQALAILEDDRQIVRIKGRGTFVAQPKLDARAGGLSRLLERRRSADVAIGVLDVSVPQVEGSIRDRLEVGRDDEVLRVTSLLSVDALPLSISYSFFRRGEVRWLEDAATPGRPLPADLVLGDHGVRLAQSRMAIETSQCGQFEAERFRVPHRTAVFLVLCTELRHAGDEARPFEVARVEYRGDLLQFRLETSGQGPEAIEATWEITPPAR